MLGLAYNTKSINVQSLTTFTITLGLVYDSNTMNLINITHTHTHKHRDVAKRRLGKRNKKVHLIRAYLDVDMKGTSSQCMKTKKKGCRVGLLCLTYFLLLKMVSNMTLNIWMYTVHTHYVYR